MRIFVVHRIFFFCLAISLSLTAELTVSLPSGIVDVVSVDRLNRTMTIVEGVGIGEPGTFVDATDKLRIDVAPTGERDDWGHGTAFNDVDGDGRLELYVIMQDAEPNRLFKFEDEIKGFLDIAKVTGCNDSFDGRGVVFADYDNDGDPDLFVANDRGPNKLFENDGGGNFSDVSAFAGVDNQGRSHSAAWADYDNDGFLDLYVCSYGTAGLPDPNLLYHNNGDGTFEEVAAAVGVALPGVPSLVPGWIDYDNDDDLDIYICNDKNAGNTMYRNNGDGTFTDVSSETGTALVMNAMGFAVADYDHNGYLDMYITNTEEANALLRNNGDGTFTDVAAALGVTVNRIGWGTAFLDYDNDGDDDLYVVNWTYTGGPGAGNVFYQNRGGSFFNVSDEIGVGDRSPGYGLTVGDYNNDGFVDMFINNQTPSGTAKSVFYECVPTSNNWIKIKTVGTTSNRDGVGAKIWVKTGSLTQIKDVRAGSSYLSQLSPEIEFGVGAATTISEIRIRWPSKIEDVFTNVAANQFVEVLEGGALKPVPMMSITRFEARSAGGGGVVLTWDIQTDETITIDGFRAYRREAHDGDEVLLNAGALIDPADRRYVDTTPQQGKIYAYVLAAELEDGAERRSQRVIFSAPFLATALAQNYPNPFNPTTTIQFTLPGRQAVDLAVFDARGKHVVTLVNGFRSPGLQNVSWDGTNADGRRVTSGIYFYRLETETTTLTRKMVLIK